MNTICTLIARVMGRPTYALNARQPRDPRRKEVTMKPPLSMVVAMTPDEFNNLHTQLSHANPATNPLSNDSGHLDEADVSFDWKYDGTNVILTITEVHSLKARLASAAQVEAGILALIKAKEETPGPTT